MKHISAEELVTLVRLFGQRVRIAPDGAVTVEREPLDSDRASAERSARAADEQGADHGDQK